MYIIEHGMGKKWKFLSYIFCIAGIVGLLSVFTSNQLAAVVQAVLLEPETAAETTRNNWIIGVIMMLMTAVVILGGIQRIAAAASKMVPFMVGIYFVSVFWKYPGGVSTHLCGRIYRQCSNGRGRWVGDHYWS
jgi:AGCS family alanine or glycine:cation symporter